MRRVAFAIPLFLLCASCAQTVNLTVRNPTEIPQEARVAIKSKQGVEKKTIGLGKMKPGEEAKRSFKARPSSRLVIKSSTATGYEAWESGPYEVRAAPDPFNLQVDLGLRGRYLRDDSDAVRQITSVFSELGPRVGFEPLSFQKGLSTWFGALAVVVLPSKHQPEMKVLYHVPPGRVSDREGRENAFPTPSSTSSATVHFIGKHTSHLIGSVPLYDSLGINPASENWYQVEWSLKGYGRVTKKEPAHWSIMHVIEAIPSDRKEAIAEALLREKDAVLLYINQLYVLKKADFLVKEGRKLPVGAQLNDSTYLTPEGAWSFESVKESPQHYEDLVLNVRGIILPIAVIKKKTRVLRRGAERPHPEFIPTYIFQIKRYPAELQPGYFISGEAQRQVRGKRF
ncbi:MAG: hypothetical protein QHH30_08700 [candidate division NC10 bacterium]|nr:hypothetical protein [candidate division NC10 bacterium]